LAEVISQTFNTKIQIVKTLDSALARHKFIIDASPAPDIIQAHHITADTYVSAPGIPCGLNVEAKTKISNRLLHDPLQLGVATMLDRAAKYHFDNRQK
jgi:pyrrolysine biosynthesis protein PylD